MLREKYIKHVLAICLGLRVILTLLLELLASFIYPLLYLVILLDRNSNLLGRFQILIILLNIIVSIFIP